MHSQGSRVRKQHQAVPLPIWQELLVGVEAVCLRVSPVYWGFGVPPGDRSAVVVVPGLMGTDLYLTELRAWLGRIGYRPYYSGIGLNAECPNLLIRERLHETIRKACKDTGRKVHVIGHSLGGVLARAIASQIPDRIASVIALGAPLRGIAAHASVLRLAEWVRTRIHKQHGETVLPECYTARCTCDFLESVTGALPPSVRQTAVYTKSDGLVDWRVCRTGHEAYDFEVSATHLGLVFNPIVYDLIGKRLAAAQQSEPYANRPARFRSFKKRVIHRAHIAASTGPKGLIGISR